MTCDANALFTPDCMLTRCSGLLTCEASNFHGSNKMSVQVTVHGKPSMPEVSHKANDLESLEKAFSLFGILFDVRLSGQKTVSYLTF